VSPQHRRCSELSGTDFYAAAKDAAAKASRRAHRPGNKRHEREPDGGSDPVREPRTATM